MHPPTKTWFHLELPELPLFQQVGGNTRHGHWAAEYRAQLSDRGRWVDLMTSHNYRRLDAVLFDGKVHAQLTLRFDRPESTWPDEDNCLRAIKGLVDLLQPFKVVSTQLENGRFKARTTGHLGVIADDANIHWLPMVREVGHPATIIDLVPIGERLL